ncbi:MAG: ABC transporter permease [Acidimicrobiales bacterium]|nr:ABC transporter permease [Acidimicrobiales bacterium]
MSEAQATSISEAASRRTMIGLSDVRAAFLVAGLTLRDSARRRSGWMATLLLGALFAAMVAGFGAVTERVEQRARTISFRVALDGDLSGAERFLAELATDRLALTASEDAPGDVTRGVASAGVRLPPRLDDRLDQGENAEIELFYRSRHDNSVTAYNTIVVRLAEIENQRLERQILGSAAPAVRFEEHLVAADPRISRLQFSRTLAALVATLCLGVVSSVAAVFGAGRESRSAEPLLVLPMSRRALAAGIALGSYPTAASQLLAAVVVLTCVSALPTAGLGQSLSSVTSMLAYGVPTALLLGVLAAATGCLAGSIGTGSEDAVGLGDFLSVPFILVGVVLLLRPDIAANGLTYAVPAMGPALALRDSISGSLTISGACIAVVTTLLWSALLILLASRWIGDERRLLRPTN